MIPTDQEVRETEFGQGDSLRNFLVRQPTRERSDPLVSGDDARPQYLQYGCGLSVGMGWLNYDNSPTLRLQRVPIIGELASRSMGSVRFPAQVRYGNICAGLLAAPESCAGVYASHVLEHLSLEDFRVAIRNTFEMLRPGGLFRLIVPDLEVRARKYLELLPSGSDFANSFFMEGTHLGSKHRARGPIARLRDQFGNSKHLWMWDEPSMTSELMRIGFVSIRRCVFNDSTDGMFKEVEERSRFVDEIHRFDELAIECAKPPNEVLGGGRACCATTPARTDACFTYQHQV